MPPSDDDTNKQLKQLYSKQRYRAGTRQQKTEKQSCPEGYVGDDGAHDSRAKHYGTKNSKKF